MTKKTWIISAIIAVALVVVIILGVVFGSSETGLKNNPKIDAPVSTNGGITVEKDGYLYFANGFINTTSTELKAGDNKYGDITYGGIYRIKLGDNNAISYDDNGFMLGAELVVSHIVGYNNGTFYIMGNNIYYSTPTNEQDKNGESLTKHTSIYKINIDGTKSERLYFANSTEMTTNDWAVYNDGKDEYLVVKDTSTDDGNIITSINTKTKKSKVIAKNTTSSGLIQSSKYYYGSSVVEGYTNYIYYTRAVTEDDSIKTGNILARVKVSGGSEEIMLQTAGNTYSIVGVKNNSVYYSMTNNVVSGSIYRSTVSANQLSNPVLRVVTPSTKYVILDRDNLDTSTVDVLSVENTDSAIYANNGANRNPIISGSSLNIIKVVGDRILYTNNGILTIADIEGNNIITLPTNDKTLYVDTTTLIDFDGINVYVYAQYTSENGSTNYYLNRIYTNSSEIKTEFLGKFDQDHIPAQPDNSGIENPEEWTKWIV